MKGTNNINGVNTSVNGNGQHNGNGAAQGKPVGPVPLSQAIEEAKAKNPDAKEPSNYPAPAVKPETEPAPEVVAVVPQAPAAPLVPTRSRAEEIDFQIEKARKMQLINAQLQSLKNKLAEFKEFTFLVDKDDDQNFGRMEVYDSRNRQFTCTNVGLIAWCVGDMKAKFEAKIMEKETELLEVSRL